MIVDYITPLRTKREDDSDVFEKHLAEQLREIAKTMAVPIITASQIQPTSHSTAAQIQAIGRAHRQGMLSNAHVIQMSFNYDWAGAMRRRRMKKRKLADLTAAHERLTMKYWFKRLTSRA